MDILLEISSIQKRSKVIKITNRLLDHLGTNTNSRASRRRAVVLAPASPVSGKTYRNRACCNRHMGSCHAKTIKDKRTRETTNDNRRSEETDLNTNQQSQKKIESQEIHR